jgi:hypothetical protein
MTDLRACVDELRRLAEAGSGEPRRAAAKVVHSFVSTAFKGDVKQLRTDQVKMRRERAITTEAKPTHRRMMWRRASRLTNRHDA